MAEPITQDPTQQAVPKPPRPPIDLDKIRGSPSHAAPGAPPPDRSWLDEPVSAPEAHSQEQPSWFDGAMHSLGQGFAAIPRGAANALAAGANLTNAAFRMLPGIDENTPFFGRAPEHPLGTSDNFGAGLVENIAQFGTGMVLGGPAVKAVGAAAGAGVLLTEGGGLSLTGSAVAGAVADFTAFDAHAGNLADLIAKIPGVEGPMRQYMSGTLTSEQDNEFEGRIKNSLYGIGFGSAVHAVLSLTRFGRAVARARAAGKFPEEAIAEAHAAVPDVKKSLAELYDMRAADQSPFKGQLVDDSIAKASKNTTWINADGSEAVGFTVMEQNPKPALRDVPNPEMAAMLEKNLQHESVVASQVLGKELKYDESMTNAYLEAVRKSRDAGNPEQAAAQAQVEAVKGQLSARGQKRLSAPPPSGQSTESVLDAIKYKTADWQQRQTPRFVSLTSEKVGDPEINKQLLTDWVNKHGTLLDNPQTTIRLGKDGTAEIGVALHEDQWTGEARKIAKSIKDSPDMTPAQLGEAAQGLTKPRQPSPPNPEPPPPQKPPSEPGAPAKAGEPAGVPIPEPPKRTPHQVYLGEVGFTDKDADEIAELLHGEFVQGMAERGQVAIEFKARGEMHTDASNPKRMTREDALSRKMLEKGLNLEGLKGQPEVAAQGVRVLEKMNLALREAENPALIHESFAQMTARAQVERDIILGLPSIQDQASYVKLAERAGVKDANRIGAQAKASVDIASGIAIDLAEKAADFAKRKAANQAIEPWEYAAWCESRGLGKDVASMGINLKNALSHNLYMQRGEIKPVGNIARMTTAQIQANPKELERILMENGGIGKIEEDAATIAASGGRDLYQIANTLKLAQASNGLLGLTHEIRFAAMLSGLATPVRQFFGNLGVAAWQPFRRGFSAMAALPFTRDPHAVAALKGELAESVGTYLAYFESIPEMVQGYKQGWMEGPKLNPRGGVFNVASRADRQQITARNFGLDPESDEGFAVQAIGDMMSVFSRNLAGGDEMTRVLVHRATAKAALNRQWLQEGLSGKELGAAVGQDMDRLIYKGQALSVDQLERRALDQVNREGYTGIHAAEKKNRLVAEWQQSDWYKRVSGLNQFALDQAEEASLSKSLDPRTISGWVGDGINRHPLLMFASPFYKTSVNIAKFGLQHLDFPAYARWIAESKLNIAGSAYENTTNRLLADMRSGDPIRQANARGRLLLGATVSSGVAAMYMSGMVTGRGPADPKLRSQMMQNGWQPYSFNIMGKHYSYAGFEPLATVIGLIADIAQSAGLAPDDRLADIGDMAKGVGIALANNITNKSYAQGVADFTEAITKPEEGFKKWAQSIATSFVPNILRDTSNVVDGFAGQDPTLKEIRSMHDAMVAKIPYMSRDLEPRRNFLGEPIMRSKKLGEDIFGPLAGATSIMQVGKDSDPVMREVNSLGRAISIPGSKRAGYDMFDIKTASGQSSYDRWMENSGTIKLGSKQLRQALEQMIASPFYQRMSGESLNGMPSARVNEIQSLVDRYRRAAMLQTQREIPELNQAEVNSRLMRAAARSGQPIGAR